MSRNSAVRILLVVLFMTAFAGVGVAQVITGTILGSVTDESKAPLPGVTLTLKNLDKGDTRTAVTGGTGDYRASGLSLGNYEVRAELAGFQPVVRTGVTVNVGSESTLNFSLRIANIAEAIVVHGDVPIVNTTESTVSYLVDEKKIQDLPLNGRDYASLILLQPNVTMSRASADSSNVGRGIKISVAGSRPNQNLFTLDGTDYNDALNNTPGSAQGNMTGVETIKEFQVLTNTMSAEYGRASGGVFNVVTKSGTNELHGSAFAFHRDDNLDSKNFFDDEKPSFRRNQFGGSFGGPVVRDRTFFFTSYEGLREFKEITTVATVPDDDARRGVLPGVTPFNVNPLIVPYLNLYPQGNGGRILDSSGQPTGFAEFRGINPRDSDQTFAMGRLDHSITDRDSAFIRYVYEDSVLDEPITFPAFPNIVRNKKHVATFEERHLFSANTLNEFRLGFNSSKPSEDINPVDPHTEIAFVSGKAFGEINVTGLSDLGTDRTNPKGFFSDVYQVTDNFSVVAGRHALKSGFNFEHFRYDGNSETRTRGRLRFRGLSDFLKGTTRDFELAKPGSDFQRDYRQ
ncbi:MAG TPA: TonB-dependent receptor, partial [Thermoanaerobaculia bacterium]|nr:TonB-dependent receptor [Thermoanaerobaculia bacterium]